jgi:hypothetical protein
MNRPTAALTLLAALTLTACGARHAPMTSGATPAPATDTPSGAPRYAVNVTVQKR